MGSPLGLDGGGHGRRLAAEGFWSTLCADNGLWSSIKRCASSAALVGDSIGPVNYGPAVVNRHGIELFILDSRDRISESSPGCSGTLAMCSRTRGNPVQTTAASTSRGAPSRLPQPRNQSAEQHHPRPLVGTPRGVHVGHDADLLAGEAPSAAGYLPPERRKRPDLSSGLRV